MDYPILIRHSPPSKLDHAPHNTECRVVSTLSGDYDLYQQMSMQEEDPVWEFIEHIKNVNP